jgi:L-arabinose isomerase
MHTFSPGQDVDRRLLALDKPMLHLHTQFNRDFRGPPSTWTS